MNTCKKTKLGKNYLSKFNFIPLFLILIAAQSCAILGIERNSEFQNPFASGVKDISYGMSIDAVSRIWGEPTHKEIPLSGRAGGAYRGHERWIYTNNLSSLTSTQTRIIYFENGRVVGWETH